jgi:hypothetical protein
VNPLLQALASLQACATLDEARYLTAMQYKSARAGHDERFWMAVLEALQPSEIVN